MSANRALFSAGLALSLSAMMVLVSADGSEGALVGSTSEPTLLLDPRGLADDVDPGDIIAILGDVAIFWLDEIDQQGTPSYLPDDTVRFALWRSDGTSKGTYPLLPDEVSLTYYSDTLNGVLFFAVCRPPGPIQIFFGSFCDWPEGLELWRTDGSREGTFRVLEDGPHKLAFLQVRVTRAIPELGKFFFMTEDREGSYYLWITDGSKEGTRLLKDFSSIGDVACAHLVASRHELSFVCGGTVAGTVRLWVGRSDATPSGTTIFRAQLDDEYGAEDWTPVGRDLFLVARSAEKEPHPQTGQLRYRRSLWVLEGGTQRFRRLADLGYMAPFTRLRTIPGVEHLFLDFVEFTQGPQLWVSDGTVSGTAPLGPVEPSSLSGPVWTEPLRLPGGRALLRLTTEQHGAEPWSTDGDPAGTDLVSDLCVGQCSSDPIGSVLLGDWYLFSAEDKSHGRELWRWQPATGRNERVADLCPGECSGSPFLLDRVGDRLFYAVRDRDQVHHGWEVLADGTAAQYITDFGNLRLGGFELIFNRGVYAWRILADRVVFWARDAQDHLGLWAMEAPASEAVPPPGPALRSDELPGFAVKVRISPGSGEPVVGRAEADCIPQTLCVSGALAGRSEVFVRVVGPKPNGKLWPTLVKFTTSTVHAWIEQLSTGMVRYYRLDGATPGSSGLPGLFDRDGFPPIVE